MGGEGEEGKGRGGTWIEFTLPEIRVVRGLDFRSKGRRFKSSHIPKKMKLN
jgi:hypothetical protein